MSRKDYLLLFDLINISMEAKSVIRKVKPFGVMFRKLIAYYCEIFEYGFGFSFKPIIELVVFSFIMTRTPVM
jgi:hypothetical protein